MVLRMDFLTLKLLFFLSSLLIVPAFCFCPEGCICSSKSVICTCSELPWSLHQPKDLHLTGLSPTLDYIDLLVVHSCDRLIISNDTFSGIEISEQLKFLDIASIEISPFAFRGIRKSPKQFVIERSYFNVIPKNAFTGLTNVEHFWFKNVTIKRIEKHAFAKLSNFNYIYFRSSNIYGIDNEAFGQMHHINYFYMRENVTLHHVDSYIFLESHINEIMFENSNIKATDFSLNGVYVNRMEIISTKWHTSKVHHMKLVQQNIGILEARNCTFNRLIPGLMYNVTNIIIDNAQIHHLASLPTYYLQTDNFCIRNSKIFQWHSNAIPEKSRVKLMSLKNCQIDKTHFRGIYNAQIDTMFIEKSNITSMVKLFFEGSNITKLMISETRFDQFGGKALSNAYFDSLLLNESKFFKIENKAFANLIAKQTQFSNCVFYQFPDYMFYNAKVTDMTILSCSFHTAAPKNIFSNLKATNLHFTHSEIACSPHDCETNSLFFKDAVDNLPWKFEHNRCISSHTLHTINPLLVCQNATDIHTHFGLYCQRKLIIEECVCSNEEPAIIPKSKAIILTIGDCDNVILAEIHPPQLYSLFIYRTKMIIVKSLPHTLQRLEVLHSTARFEEPLLLLPQTIDAFIFNGVVIEAIGSKTFASGQIDHLGFNKSVIIDVAEDAFVKSVINNLLIEESEVLVAGDLYAYVKNAKISRSKLKRSTSLTQISTLCFENNTVDCGCSGKMPNFSQNLCNQESNQCVTNDNTEYWRKTRNTKDFHLCGLSELQYSIPNSSCYLAFFFLPYFSLILPWFIMHFWISQVF